MALVLNQVVRVRVAVVIDTIDLSGGQVYDEETAQWTDVVWVDLLGSTVQPLEFGDVEFWAEVNALAVTRLGTTRPSVRLRAWRSGGLTADEYVVTNSGSTTANRGRLQRGGADLLTTLPGLGAVPNQVRVRGFRDQRLGWTGRVPNPLSWDHASLAILKRVKYGADASFDQEYLAGVSGFSGDLASFNAWLAANVPEYGSALTVGASVEFTRTLVGTPWTYRTKYVAVFTLHAFLASDFATWSWTVRGALIQVASTEVAVATCGGRAGVLTFYGDTFGTNSTNAAAIGASQHQFGTTTGGFATPAAAGGTVTASPRGALYSGGPIYGVDIGIAVNAQGRLTTVTVVGAGNAGTIDGVSAWGACKMEGGLLA